MNMWKMAPNGTLEASTLALNDLARSFKTFMQMLVREELASLESSSTPPVVAEEELPAAKWMTPPAAARALSIPVKTVRALAREGRVEARFRNSNPESAHKKLLVNVDEVARAVSATRGSASAASDVAGTDQQVARILASAPRR